MLRLAPGVVRSTRMRLSQPVRGVQVTAFDIRMGDLIEYGEGAQLWKVQAAQSVRQAMGRAFMQLELRHVKTGMKKDVRMRTDEAVEKAAMDAQQKMQVLYWDQEAVTVMEPTTFEQMEIPLALLEERHRSYLQEGMVLVVDSYKGAIATVSLPTKVPFTVKSVTALVGSKEANRDIPAELENGLKIKVPKFVKPGDRVLLDTRDGSYAGKE